MGYKHTYDTIYTHFQGITNNIYGFGRPFFFLLLHLLARPQPILHGYQAKSNTVHPPTELDYVSPRQFAQMFDLTLTISQLN